MISDIIKIFTLLNVLCHQLAEYNLYDVFRVEITVRIIYDIRKPTIYFFTSWFKYGTRARWSRD